MSAHTGRLYTKASGEGGADAIYDGAAKSAFESANVAKPSQNFAAAKPRFQEKHETTPDVEVQTRGIAETARGKPVATWEAKSARFKEHHEETPDAAQYNTARSAFDDALKHNRPSPMMNTPEKHKDRSAGWMTNEDQVNSPPPADLPGAFNISNKPSAFISSSAPRFKGNNDAVSYGDPGAEAPLSDFAKAAANTRPSATTASSSDRFKKSYDVTSYGDPGTGKTSADIEREQLQAKIARQKAQAEAVAERDLNKY